MWKDVGRMNYKLDEEVECIECEIITWESVAINLDPAGRYWICIDCYRNMLYTDGDLSGYP